MELDGRLKHSLWKMKIIVLDDNDLEEIIRCRDISDKVDEKHAELYNLGHQ
jgi:hypothetical protein